MSLCAAKNNFAPLTELNVLHLLFESLKIGAADDFLW